MQSRSGSQPASEGQRRAVIKSGYVPRQSLSAYGKQLTGVYEQGGSSPHPYSQSRTVHFRNGIYASKPARPRPIAYGSSMVPQHRGYTGVVRATPVQDPGRQDDSETYASFKSQPFKEGTPSSSRLSPEEKNYSRKAFKDMGRRAYKTEFKTNRESRRDAPIRAKKPQV